MITKYDCNYTYIHARIYLSTLCLCIQNPTVVRENIEANSRSEVYSSFSQRKRNLSNINQAILSIRPRP